jgi:hypothetical protein
MGDKPEELVHVPQDLTLVSDTELEAYGNKAVAEFDRINGLEDVTADSIQYGLRLADDIDRVRAEVAARNARAKQQAEANRAKLLKDQANLRARVHGTDDVTGGGVATEARPEVDVEAIAAAAARGATAALVNVLGDRVAGRALTQVVERPTLADARRFAPEGTEVAPARLSVTASVDIPGVARGEGVDNLDRMVDIFQRKAKSMPVTSGQPNRQLVASIRNEFEHTVDDRTSPGQMEELIRHITSDERKQSLVAAGGWCAPSEIRYDFFNIACEDGLIDLPTFGVSRGGIQFPVSPSLADVFGDSPNQAFGGFSTTFSGDSIPWLWTEADDTAAVTGSPTKPCIRVPCPTFSEERLECYGVCVTAGNLTDDAYPEATRNFLRLMMSAHAHAMNGRIISLMVARSAAAIDTGGFAVTGQPVYQQVYGGLSLAATDYRARYGMCQDDVLEAVAPFWVKETIKADLAWRNGVDVRQISDAEVNQHFAALNIRVQWVNDWQVRGAGQFGNATAMTAWPTSATFMLYAAGTFIMGNGLQLDLGVVRDSTLNETNDHTAAWSEECHLVARVGHESRRYTINFCVNGKTGAQLASTSGCNL